MKLNLDNARIRELIPNIIHEVEGETPLYDKLRPWLASARLWLEKNIIGTDYQPEGELLSMAERIVVNRAFADAVPSLDVTLSPAGFAVINTDGRAPASKERIERLIAALLSAFDSDIINLLAALHEAPEWGDSRIGQWFRATFIPDFTNVYLFRQRDTLITTYHRMRVQAVRFETVLEGFFLGHGFLSSLRSQYPAFEADGTREIYSMIHTAELRFITAHLDDNTICCPPRHDVWHLARPIIDRLNYWPNLKMAWESEMGDKFKVEPFKNTVKGGYFF